jgi:hypothetical protein
LSKRAMAEQVTHNGHGKGEDQGDDAPPKRLHPVGPFDVHTPEA